MGGRMKYEYSHPSTNPWFHRGIWVKTIHDARAQDRPITHIANAEMVDASGEYRGIEVGRYTSRALAESALDNWTIKKHELRR